MQSRNAKESRITLKSLSQKYARRAREFSDTVSLLGKYDEATPELVKLFAEIRRRRASCAEAEEKIERYLQAKGTTYNKEV
jgi:primosomal protein N''